MLHITCAYYVGQLYLWLTLENPDLCISVYIRTVRVRVALAWGVCRGENVSIASENSKKTTVKRLTQTFCRIFAAKLLFLLQFATV